MDGNDLFRAETTRREKLWKAVAKGYTSNRKNSRREKGVFAKSDSETPEYVAYYFNTSKRCGPCTKIEQWSQEAIQQNFKEEIKAGDLEWKAINRALSC